MSLNGDSYSTSSGCVSDMEILSEDQLPDSPISDSTVDSLISSTNSVIKCLPNTDDYHLEDRLITISDLSISGKVPDIGIEVDELLKDSELMSFEESEIIIDSTSPSAECSATLDTLPLNQILTGNCYQLDYDRSPQCQGIGYQSYPFEFGASLVNACSKADSIKSDGHTSGHESDCTRQSSDSGSGSARGSIRPATSSSGSSSSAEAESPPHVYKLPALTNVMFKEMKDFKCMSTAATPPLKTSVSSEDVTSNSSKSSSISNISGHYCCKWTNCDWPGTRDDLVDHIREIHVELQPYHQQKHNWTEVQTKTKANLKSQTNCKKILDSSPPSLPAPPVPKKVESTHQQQYVCLWEGCKVYGKGSSSRNWLERHVLEQHSGPRPFKCIVEGCGQRFKVQSALERHVNSHFKPSVYEQSNSNCSTDVSNLFNNGSADTSVCINSGSGLSPFEMHLLQKSRATMSAVRCKTNDCNQSSNQHNCTSMGTPNKILKRKKSNQKVRRKTCFYVKCSDDYFDECVMEQIRYGLIQLNAQKGLDISGTQTTITFHSEVIARRENSDGEVNVLLKWEPNHILPDVWVPEDKVQELKTKTVPISTLPNNILAQLVEQNNGGEGGAHSKPKSKQRRK